MTVRVEVVGALAKYVAAGYRLEGDYLVGSSIRSLVEGLGIPIDLVAIVMVNGAMRDMAYVIGEGDVVKLLPIVGGG
jgi:molybdopterin converting factor small subunit